MSTKVDKFDDVNRTTRRTGTLPLQQTTTTSLNDQLAELQTTLGETRDLLDDLHRNANGRVKRIDDHIRQR